MSHSIVLINAQDIYATVGQGIYNACASWHIGKEFENVYDWCVTEAISRITNRQVGKHFSIQNHNIHDVYRCIYTEVFEQLECVVKRTLSDSGIFINGNEPLKVLVTFNEIIIVHKPFKHP